MKLQMNIKGNGVRDRSLLGKSKLYAYLRLVIEKHSNKQGICSLCAFELNRAVLTISSLGFPSSMMIT